MDFMNDRLDIFEQIDHVVESGQATRRLLLEELLTAMTTPELKENWDYIKQMWEFDV